MPNSDAKTERENTAQPKNVAQLMADQTSVILGGVDERFVAQKAFIKEELAVREVRFLSALEGRLGKLEKRWLEKFNKLTTTLDKFLKRLADLEDELAFLKKDLNRVKAVIRQKLGASLD